MAPQYLADRAVIRLTPEEPGEDVAAFLQGLVTNDIRAHDHSYNALLTPQGKVLFDFFVEHEYIFPGPPGLAGRQHNPNGRADGDFQPSGDILIDCEASRADALVKRLMLYRLRRRIAIAADPALCVRWPAGHHDGRPDPRFPADGPHSDCLGHRYIGERISGMVDVSAEYHARRLAHGISEGVAELGDGTTLWLECNAAELNGVSFTKGCYVGQENTARMNWRSKVNRRLVIVPLPLADDKRTRARYPEYGWAVEHRRVEDMAGLDLPDWLAAAVAGDGAAGR